MIIIVVLSYLLYDSIVTPYQEVIQKEQMREKVRARMGNVRDALIRYKQEQETFPDSLDQLVTFLEKDSLVQVQGDSLFTDPAMEGFNPDSIIISPRPPHKRFTYILNDTLRPNIYMLKDPDTDDRIGDTLKTTMLNAGTWE